MVVTSSQAGSDTATVVRRTHPFRGWRVWTVVGVAVVLVAGWGLAVYSYSVGQERSAAIAELNQSIGDLSARLGSVTEERDRLQANKKTVEDAAQRREDGAKQQEDAAKRHEDAVKKREDEVKKREDEVTKREDAVTEQERVQAQNTIGEGSWAVGVDVQPGTYRTKDAVTGRCYWEIDADANGDNIVANDNVTGGRPTVTLAPGQFFKTSRCGEWIKV